jgi:hypothetical protein
MTTATTTVTFKSAELGRTVELTTYVDPAPGQAGTDRVAVECGHCNNGVYMGFSRLTWEGRGRRIAPWCFRCNGSNVRYISVTTARRNAKADAFAAEYADELRTAREAAVAAANAAIAAAEFAAAYDAACVENARRAALVQGFLGKIDEKVAFTGTVKVAKYIAGSYNRSSSMFLVFTTDAGQNVSGFSSSQTVFELGRGDKVSVTAKVKKTESYEGQDQTVVTSIKATVLEAAE